VLPDGAGAAPEPDPDDPDPDLGAGFAGAADCFGAALAVVVVRRSDVVDVVRRAGVVGAVVTAVVDVDGGTVVGSVGGGSSSALPGSSTRCAGAAAATVSSPFITRTGDAAGGAETCMSASTGAPAIAAHSATGTARRAFLDPRVVRTPPLVQNAGAALLPRHVLKLTQRRFRTRRRT
jgi:hypothetical protein